MGGSYVNDFLHNGRVKRLHPGRCAPPYAAPGHQPGGACATAAARWSPSTPSLIATGTMARPSWCATAVHRPMVEGKAAPGVSSGVAMRIVEDLPANPAPRHHLRVDGRFPAGAPVGRPGARCCTPSRSCSSLCLAALYESWTVPLSMLAVPLGVLGALLATCPGADERRVLPGRAAHDHGPGLEKRNSDRRVRRAVAGAGPPTGRCHGAGRAPARLRPILMTSLWPLARRAAPGAGHGCRCRWAQCHRHCRAGGCWPPPCWGCSWCRCSSCWCAAGSSAATPLLNARRAQHETT